MGRPVDELAAGGRRLIETHISWVLLEDAEVYKLKKPVDLGFLDFRTLEQRRAACDAEVTLNARLAPDVYLGVVPVVRGEGGSVRLGGDGEVVDYAVRMRRLPDHDRADVRLAEGRLAPEDVDRIALRIAGFHAAAATSEAISRHGEPDAIAANVEENFEQTRTSLPRYLSSVEIADLERFHRETVSHRAPFLERIAKHRIRDGHGDLRLEHVYIDEHGEIRIIDCIEFNERFRYQDVAADVAFFSMDLTRSGASALGEHFLARYAREAQDFDLYPLVDFYQSYRAFVRAKVATFLAADAGASAETRARAEANARRDFLLSLAYERHSLAPPCVVAVGGLVASGKSTLAETIGDLVVAPIVDSDRTRKHLAGVAATTPLGSAGFEGAYSEAATERVYDELLRRADLVLRSGRPVVLDASFRTREHRARARALADAHAVPFYFVECRADRSVLEARLRARAERETCVSDARAELLDAFAASFEPVDELASTAHLVVFTSGPPADTARALQEFLPIAPPD